MSHLRGFFSFHLSRQSCFRKNIRSRIILVKIQGEPNVRIIEIRSISFRPRLIDGQRSIKINSTYQITVSISLVASRWIYTNLCEIFHLHRWERTPFIDKRRRKNYRIDIVSFEINLRLNQRIFRVSLLVECSLSSNFSLEERKKRNSD